MLPKNSQALHLLQRVRDEVHRVSNTYHRELRGSHLTRSSLDDIPGIGDTRKKELLKRFGSLERVKSASLEELTAAPGMNRKAASSVYNSLHPAESSGDSLGIGVESRRCDSVGAGG